MKTINFAKAKKLILIGILASILVGIGEWLLHFLPDGPGGEIAMLEKVPLSRASFGHYFVVFGAPLYFAGYYGMKLIFQKHNPILANLLFITGLLSFSIGGVWVSSRYLGAVILQRSAGTPNHEIFLQAYEDHYQILVWALRIFVAILSILYVMLILKNKISLPKWIAIFNPIILLAITISSLIWLKPIGIHLAPIAMNFTHFIFFTLLFIHLKSNYDYNEMD